MQLFAVGRSLSQDGQCWELMGVFSSEQIAVENCGVGCFIGPLVLDQRMPEETVQWPGAYYPEGVADGE